MTLAEENLFQNITPGSAPARAQLDTSTWFDRAHTTSEESPIDEYLANLAGINRLYLQAENRGDYTPVLGSLVYMGMVSAAEGYFRSLLRRLILLDPGLPGERLEPNRQLRRGVAPREEPAARSLVGAAFLCFGPYGGDRAEGALQHLPDGQGWSCSAVAAGSFRRLRVDLLRYGIAASTVSASSAASRPFDLGSTGTSHCSKSP